MEVSIASIYQEDLAILVQYLMVEISAYHRDYICHSDLLHYSVPIYNFVTGD
jgi:hypothetical protein